MLVNGDISAETLKSYAEVFVNNDLNYAFVGQTAKNLNDDEIGITETYSTASSTVFDSVSFFQTVKKCYRLRLTLLK